MFCPIKHLSPKDSPTDQCNPNCAWVVKQDGIYACAFAVLAARENPNISYNVATLPKAMARHGRAS